MATNRGQLLFICACSTCGYYSSKCGIWIDAGNLGKDILLFAVLCSAMLGCSVRLCDGNMGLSVVLYMYVKVLFALTTACHSQVETILNMIAYCQNSTYGEVIVCSTLCTVYSESYDGCGRVSHSTTGQLCLHVHAVYTLGCVWPRCGDVGSRQS